MPRTCSTASSRTRRGSRVGCSATTTTTRSRGSGAGRGRGNPAPHPLLVDVHRVVQRTWRKQFDGVALAWYRDGRDSVAWHADRELKWLDDTVIAVLTLGRPRPWLLRPKSQKFADEDGRGAADPRPASGRRRPVRDGRAGPGGLGPHRAQGPRPAGRPGVTAVALDLSARPSGARRLLPQASPLQPGLIGARRGGRRAGLLGGGHDAGDQDEHPAGGDDVEPDAGIRHLGDEGTDVALLQ